MLSVRRQQKKAASIINGPTVVVLRSETSPASVREGHRDVQSPDATAFCFGDVSTEANFFSSPESSPESTLCLLMRLALSQAVTQASRQAHTWALEEIRPMNHKIHANRSPSRQPTQPTIKPGRPVRSRIIPYLFSVRGFTASLWCAAEPWFHGRRPARRPHHGRERLRLSCHGDILMSVCFSVSALGTL